MERNENGYPGRRADLGNAEHSGGNNGCAQGNDTSCLDNMMPGYVYAPMQKFCMLYSAEDALRHGTLFEQLYKPLGVYGRE